MLQENLIGWSSGSKGLCEEIIILNGAQCNYSYGFSHIKGTNTLVTKIWLKVIITLINVSTQISGIKLT